MSLADAPAITTAWKRPQACQRRTRERLLSVLNACVPVPVLISSPSVIFTDEQALIGETGAIYSSASEEAASSIASYNPDEMPSQPESQVYILLTQYTVYDILREESINIHFVSIP